MEETFPAIKERAETEGAKIFFADEAGCRTNHHSGRTWSPVGQTPVVRNLGKHESIGMASAISMRGAMFWMTFDGAMNSTLFTEFLDLLIHDIGGKIFLIVDRVKYHTSKETSEWAKEHKDRIELFFLPSYSPDLNPDEWVWKNVKNDRIAREVPQQPGHLFEIARQALRRLHATPAKIRAFFADPHLAYIRRAYA
jgi:transposase